MDIRNCKNCGRLFNYIGKNLCPECLKAKNDEFTVVKEYVRNNPAAGIAEVSEATEVSVKQIREWIREERLILTEASATAGINCESCGRPIRTGRFCPPCKVQMTRSLSQAFVNPTKVAEERQKAMSDKDRMRYLTKK